MNPSRGRDSTEHAFEQSEVDGGIHEVTAPQVVKAGANLLVAGSAVYNEHESVAQAIARLRHAIQ